MGKMARSTDAAEAKVACQVQERALREQLERETQAERAGRAARAHSSRTYRSDYPTHAEYDLLLELVDKQDSDEPNDFNLLMLSFVGMHASLMRDAAVLGIKVEGIDVPDTVEGLEDSWLSVLKGNYYDDRGRGLRRLSEYRRADYVEELPKFMQMLAGARRLWGEYVPVPYNRRHDGEGEGEGEEEEGECKDVTHTTKLLNSTLGLITALSQNARWRARGFWSPALVEQWMALFVLSAGSNNFVRREAPGNALEHGAGAMAVPALCRVLSEPATPGRVAAAEALKGIVVDSSVKRVGGKRVGVLVGKVDEAAACEAMDALLLGVASPLSAPSTNAMYASFISAIVAAYPALLAPRAMPVVQAAFARGAVAVDCSSATSTGPFDQWLAGLSEYAANSNAVHRDATQHPPSAEARWALFESVIARDDTGVRKCKCCDAKASVRCVEEGNDKIKARCVSLAGQAMAALAAGKHADAVAGFSNAIAHAHIIRQVMDLDEPYRQWRVGLGRAYLGMGQAQAALAIFEHELAGLTSRMVAYAATAAAAAAIVAGQQPQLLKDVIEVDAAAGYAEALWALGRVEEATAGAKMATDALDSLARHVGHSLLHQSWQAFDLTEHELIGRYGPPLKERLACLTTGLEEFANVAGSYAFFAGCFAAERAGAAATVQQVSKEEAPAVVPSGAAWREGSCDKCGAWSAALKKCAGCRRAVYCGAACQQQAWASHKAACRRAKAHN